MQTTPLFRSTLFTAPPVERFPSPPAQGFQNPPSLSFSPLPCSPLRHGARLTQTFPSVQALVISSSWLSFDAVNSGTKITHNEPTPNDTTSRARAKAAAAAAAAPNNASCVSVPLPCGLLPETRLPLAPPLSTLTHLPRLAPSSSPRGRLQHHLPPRLKTPRAGLPAASRFLCCSSPQGLGGGDPRLHPLRVLPLRSHELLLREQVRLQLRDLAGPTDRKPPRERPKGPMPRPLARGGLRSEPSHPRFPESRKKSPAEPAR